VSGETYYLTEARGPDGRLQRDTYAQHRMRQRLRENRRPLAAERWAKLPLATRQVLCTAALGMRGLEVYANGWEAIEVRARLKIIAEAQHIAASLV